MKKATMAIAVGMLALLAITDSSCGGDENRVDVTQLAAEDGDEYYPYWSPDGKTIAYEVDSQDQAVSIWTMNPDGSGKAELLREDEKWIGAPVYSPDGTMLAFFHSGAIGIADSNGTIIRLLDHPEGKSHDFPAWSPDGSRIAYTESISSPGDSISSELWIVDSDGTNRTMLLGDLDDKVKKSWSHDGTRIVFSSGGNLWLISPDGSGLVQLTDDADSLDDHPDWSPDDGQIVFQSDGKLPDGRDTSAIETIGVDGEGRRVLLDVYDNKDWSRIGEPRWSPDGDRIVFAVKTRGNEYDIWLLDITLQ